MELTTLLNYLLGGTSLLGAFTTFFFLGKSRRKEEADTQIKEIEAEKAKMELGEEYLKKVMEISEMTYQATLKNGTDNESIITELREVKTTTRDIVDYLNGGFQDYLEKKGDNHV